MNNFVELRGGQTSGATRTAALSGLLPLGMLAFIAWKVLEGGKETLY